MNYISWHLGWLPFAGLIGGDVGTSGGLLGFLSYFQIVAYRIAPERLGAELNFNVMLSQRGLVQLAHSEHELEIVRRWCNAIRMNGVDTEMLTLQQIERLASPIDMNGRFPIVGGFLQRRAGICRHDAVVWGYARGASALGVDLVQNCEVTGIRREGNRVTGVETTRGFIGARKVGMAVAGSSSRVAAMVGMKLPIESHVLQAFVSESIKPFIDCVVTFGAGHFYISQSDKGGLVFGGDLDGYNSYAQRGNMPVVEDVCEGGMALMPRIGRVRLLRSWGGIMDMSMDGSPIIDRTPIEGLYLNSGWCYGGFKATPASGLCFAHLIATETSHEVAKAYRLDRFATGHAIDEKGMGPHPNLH